MGLKSDRLKPIKALINLFISEDEITILEAIKILNLKHEQFLLVGKGILNPKFVPESLFKALKITDKELLQERERIKDFSAENYENWKEKLKQKLEETIKSLGDQFMKTVNLNKGEKKDQDGYKTGVLNIEKKVAELNLVKVYLNNWKTFSFSKKNISLLISILDNPTNELKKKLSTVERGSIYSGIDVLAAILPVKELKLNQGKKSYEFNKEKQNAISVLSRALSINQEGLTNLLRLVLLNNAETVVKSFLYFFPNLQSSQEKLQKILSYTIKQVSNAQNQLEFVMSKIPNNLQGGTKFMALSKKIFKKLLLDNETRTSVSTALEFAHLISKRFLSGDSEKQFLQLFYNLTLFTKGLLSQEQITTFWGVSEPKLVTVLEILTQNDMKSRLSNLTELFDQDNPVKQIIALYGLLTHQNFQIRHNNRGTIKEESIKQYLGSKMNVYSEVFDLFEIGFERDISKFFQKALPLMRRLTFDPYLDTNLLEGLFSLSFGEHFNVGYLANKLQISPDIIDFFVSIVRLSSERTRVKEIETLTKSASTQKILTKLKIKSPEMIALSKLLFGLFENNDASISEILSGLGLKKEGQKAETKELINIELLKGFFSLQRSINATEDMFKNKRTLMTKKLESRSLFENLSLANDSNCALAITSLFCGDFLVLREFRQELDWVLLNDGSKSDVAIRNLVMGLCGIVNQNITVPLKLKDDVNSYMLNLNGKEKDEILETNYEAQNNVKDKVLPKNCMPYAISLVQQTLDLDPVWTQVFLLSPEIFKTINEKNPDITIEFLLSLVLTFSFSQDAAGDLIGLYEWNVNCAKFCGKNVDEQLRNPDLVFSDKEFFFGTFFGSLISHFNHEVIEIATQLGLPNHKFWAKYLASNDTFNAKVNQTLSYLLARQEKKKIKAQDENPSPIKVEKLPALKKGKSMKSSEVKADEAVPKPDVVPDPPKDKLQEEDKIQKGENILKVFVDCYQLVLKTSWLNVGESIPGYELTNLFMLGKITMMRNKDLMKLNYNRILFNLHQLAVNIERKLCVEEHFYKMSKFKLMKFIGISIGVPLNNVIEMCLPPSLFTQGNYS